MTYRVTFMENKSRYAYWGRTIEEGLLSLNLSVDEGVGGCCAVGSLSDFFYDYDFKRHPSDHHYVTVEAIKKGCKELLQAGCSLAYATINTEQRRTEAALLEAGFVCTTDGWAYRNRRYSNIDTGIKIFIKPLLKVLKRKSRKGE